MDYITVSFATKDPLYSKCGKSGEKNMRNLGIDYDIEYIDGTGYSKGDCQYGKAEIIMNKIKKYNKTVIWCDVDDGFVSKPEIPNKEYDFGYVVNPKKKYRSFNYLTNGIHIGRPTKWCGKLLEIGKYLTDWREMIVASEHRRLTQALGFMGDMDQLTKKKKKSGKRGFVSMDLTKYIYPHWKLGHNVDRNKKNKQIKEGKREAGIIK